MNNRQPIGNKKIQKIEWLTGKIVSSACTEVGWAHGWVRVWFMNESYDKDHMPPMINYKTGEIRS